MYKLFWNSLRKLCFIWVGGFLGWASPSWASFINHGNLSQSNFRRNECRTNSRQLCGSSCNSTERRVALLFHDRNRALVVWFAVVAQIIFPASSFSSSLQLGVVTGILGVQQRAKSPFLAAFSCFVFSSNQKWWHQTELQPTSWLSQALSPQLYSKNGHGKSFTSVGCILSLLRFPLNLQLSLQSWATSWFSNAYTAEDDKAIGYKLRWAKSPIANR